MGAVLAFYVGIVMILLGVGCCLLSVWDRRTPVNQVNEILQLKSGGKELNPPSMEELNNILKTILGIQNPPLQVGVFLVVFGIVVMILSNFINL
jgi:hypothetical protein